MSPSISKPTKRTRIECLSTLAAGLLLAMVLGAFPAAATISFLSTAEVESGNALDQLVVGDLVTIDVTIRNDGEPTLVLVGSAFGYDSEIAAFNSGQASPELFCPGRSGPPCLGLPNLAPWMNLVESDGRVRFAYLLQVSPITIAGENVIGVDGSRLNSARCTTPTPMPHDVLQALADAGVANASGDAYCVRIKWA